GAVLLSGKKPREFNLEERLKKVSEDKHKIKIERLPRKRVRPIWWTIILLAIILYLFFFLKKF
ncbi:MAG: hypothetical protein JW956_14805, partial [Calditrichaceae bacterium]|nr:hypothetical protein [Calditrichaceae bacterium]